MSARARLVPRLLVVVLIVAPAVPASGQDAQVARGVQLLKARGPSTTPGEAALAALAMVKAGVPADDPALAKTVQKALDQSTAESYMPARAGGADIYEAGVAVMMMVNLDPVAYRPLIRSAAS